MLMGKKVTFIQVFPGVSDGKESAWSTGDLGSIPGLGRTSGEGNGNQLKYSCLENSIDGGAWWATAYESQRVRYDWATNTEAHTTFIQNKLTTKIQYKAVNSMQTLFVI